MLRLLIAAVLGGALMFGWGGLAHEVLPLGHMGLSVLPSAADAAVGAAVKDHAGEPSLYFFPAIANWPNSTDKDRADYEAKVATTASGLMVVRPAGEMMPTSMFVTEAVLDMVCALIIGVVLLHVPASVGYLRRVGIATLMGLYGALDIDGSYHNWYGFPASYFHAQVVMAAVGALVAGLVVAAICTQQQT